MPKQLQRARLGYTVVEITFGVVLFLIILVVITGMVRAAAVQDRWSADRLEGASGAVQAFDHMRFDAERSVCHRMPDEQSETQSGPLRFYIAPENPTDTEQMVVYEAETGATGYLRRNGRVVSGAHFRAVRSDRLGAAPVESPYNPPNQGLVRVYMDVGETHPAGARSRTTTMGVVLLFREEALRPRFYMWNDNILLNH
jgi:hypothetical protein